VGQYGESGKPDTTVRAGDPVRPCNTRAVSYISTKNATEETLMLSPLSVLGLICALAVALVWAIWVLLRMAALFWEKFDE